ncbi:MAG: hypothetical protein QOJ42_1260, partial [Acidobacteriaceae bacterium]|nr:hypothetical protein [Acidobacteriaceae bacterium]
MNVDDLQCFPSAFILIHWGPTGFALGGLRDAERVYEKTTRGRARDARQ